MKGAELNIFCSDNGTEVRRPINISVPHDSSSLHTKTKFSYLLLLRYNIICSSHQFYIRDHYQQYNNIELKETNNNKEHDYTIET